MGYCGKCGEKIEKGANFCGKCGAVVEKEQSEHVYDVIAPKNNSARVWKIIIPSLIVGVIVSCQDSSWLLSWTINRQGQFKDQDKDKVCVWVYGLFTDVPGDYVKKPMKECTGKEITEEWLYHMGVQNDT